MRRTCPLNNFCTIYSSSVASRPRSPVSGASHTCKIRPSQVRRGHRYSRRRSPNLMARQATRACLKTRAQLQRPLSLRFPSPARHRKHDHVMAVRPFAHTRSRVQSHDPNLSSQLVYCNLWLALSRHHRPFGKFSLLPRCPPSPGHEARAKVGPATQQSVFTPRPWCRR